MRMNLNLRVPHPWFERVGTGGKLAATRRELAWGPTLAESATMGHPENQRRMDGVSPRIYAGRSSPRRATPLQKRSRDLHEEQMAASRREFAPGMACHAPTEPSRDWRAKTHHPERRVNSHSRSFDGVSHASNVGTQKAKACVTPLRMTALFYVFGLLVATALGATNAAAQGSRKDDIVFGPAGHPVAAASVRVCAATATGTPCTPLANIYTDATLTVPAANPVIADGLGNYHFYGAAGRYKIQITGVGITGTQTYPDVILAPDVSSSGAGNNISAFGLTLGGNLSVAGNAAIAGTFSTGAFAPSSL